MKNIQIVDGAMNAKFSIYEIEDSLFELIFPNGQNIEFDEDLQHRLTQQQKQAIFPKIWHHEIDKKQAQGIHGTLFYNNEFLILKDQYPNKIKPESENMLEDGKKTIQVIDENPNLELPIYQVSKDIFNALFEDKQNMAFEPESVEKLGKKAFDTLMQTVLDNPIDKTSINGIDGTFYFGSKYVKWLTKDYPDRQYYIKKYRII